MNEFMGLVVLQVDFIWKNVEDLWGDFKYMDFGKIILLFILLCCLECVLELICEVVREVYDVFKDVDVELDIILCLIVEYFFYNIFEYFFGILGSIKMCCNLEDYIVLFLDNVCVIFEEFEFGNMVIWLEKVGLLYKICQNFVKIDLYLDVVLDWVMSNIYEYLICCFGVEVNEGVEDFMMLCDIVYLVIVLLFDLDDVLFEVSSGLICILYDLICGMGGFFIDVMNYVGDYGNCDKILLVLVLYGQELELEIYVVCVVGMLICCLELDSG